MPREFTGDSRSYFLQKVPCDVGLCLIQPFHVSFRLQCPVGFILQTDLHSRGKRIYREASDGCCPLSLDSQTSLLPLGFSPLSCTKYNIYIIVLYFIQRYFIGEKENYKIISYFSFILTILTILFSYAFIQDYTKIYLQRILTEI